MENAEKDTVVEKKAKTVKTQGPAKRSFGRFSPDPLTAKRIERFMEIKRARISMYVVLVLYIFSLLGELFISNRPLLMYVDGKLYFPTYSRMLFADDFHFKVSDELELNYREFKKELKRTKRGWMWMPVIPYNPYETDRTSVYPLAMTFNSAPILGFTVTSATNRPEIKPGNFNWIPTGEYDGYKVGDKYVWIKFGSSANPQKLVQAATGKNCWIGFAVDKDTPNESNNPADYTWHKIGKNKNEVTLPDGRVVTFRYSMSNKGDMYHPLPPSWSRRHILGTDTIGRDLFARVIYGFRIAMSFSVLVTFFTFFLGTLFGIAMGYFGGAFDTISQRIIEVWDRIPYLYMIMILSAIFKPNFLLFVLINIIFGWTGPTWNMRALTYKERERDYVLAARSMGASTWRIITVHILPNIIVLLVTSLPFAISGGIGTLTSLDYLGYGLQPPTPSWGEILSMGTVTYKSAPWILTSGVTATVLILVMVTFVGEGLREAFDPRRFTVYK